jgi:hypothetical protein
LLLWNLYHPSGILYPTALQSAHYSLYYRFHCCSPLAFLSLNVLCLCVVICS